MRWVYKNNVQWFLVSIFLIVSSQVNAVAPPALSNPDVSAPVATGAQWYGELVGEATVSAGGNAAYTLPILLPPATRGMAPPLSIHYNSNMKNGLLGLGWFMQGPTSRIDRCAQTFTVDGQVRAVDNSMEDRFCLDGHRLLLVSGTYGQDGAEYRTETDRFARVVSHGNQGEGPAWFSVQQKNGNTRYYGSSDDSRIEGQGTDTVAVWAIQREEDRLGNYWRVNYHENHAQGIYYPESMDYTANDSLGLLSNASVNLVWEDRTDNFVAFKAGSKYRPHPKRLARIESFVEGSRVLQYQFSYEEVGASKRSRLTEIKQCNATGVCKKPLELAWWSDGSLEYTETTMSVPVSQHERGEGNHGVPRWHDLNGDGKPDYVFVLMTQPGIRDKSVPTNFELLLSGPNGYQPATWTAHFGVQPHQYRWVDINGDGRTDVVVGRHNSDGDAAASLDVALSTPQGFVEQVWSGFTKTPDGLSSGYQFIDMNGDKLLDLVSQEITFRYFQRGVGGYNKQNIYVSLNTGSGFAEAVLWFDNAVGQVNLIDINGDGLTDLLRTDRYAHFNTGSGFNAIAHDYRSSGYVASPYLRQSTYIDFNGDGLPDRYTRDQNNPEKFKLLYNTGKHFEYVGDDIRHIPGVDIDGDGLGDSVTLTREHGTRGTGGYWWYHTGLTIVFARDDKGLWSHNKSFGFIGEGMGDFAQLADINGDGVLDYSISEVEVYRSGINHLGYLWKKFRESGQLRIYQSQAGHLHRLKSITTGTGAQTQFTFKPITDHSIYTKRNDAALPLIDVQNSQTHVVTELKRTNGVGGHWRTSYTYEGLKHDTGGRGYLGFARIVARNHQDQTITTTDYAQAFPLVAEPVAIEVKRASDQQLVSRSDLSYSLLGQVGNQPVYPWLSERIDKVYSPDDGSLISTTNTKTQVDAFGTVTEQSAEVHDHVTGDISKTHTVNTVSNDISTWRIGQLDRQQSKFYKNGVRDASLDRLTHYSYDPVTGLLTKTHQEPGGGVGIELITEQSYDSFGNVLSQRISGPGLPLRTSTISYDTRGQFPLTLSNALGHSVNRTWDARFGNKLSETDANGQTASWTYNDFGQPVTETRPDGTQTTTRFYEDTGLPNSAYYSVTTETGKGPVRQWFDVLHRPLRSETVGFVGTRIWQDTQYDHYGRTVRQSVPYFEGDSPIYTSTRYDERNRIVAINAADPTQSQTFAYNGLTVTTTDAAGRSTVKTSNALGQVVTVVDAQNTVMNFNYDAAGHRTMVTNAVGTAQENSVTYEYDKLGRMLAQNDPDHGIYRYSYDALGQKLSEASPKMTAAGTRRTWQYDVLGRVTARTDSDGTTTWTYDDVANGSLGRGKLKTEQTANFSRSYQYAAGNYGRLTGTSTRIDGTQYSGTITYNNIGQVATQTYPAANGSTPFTVAYRYNAAGFLERVQSPDGASVYYQLVDADAAGRMSLRWLGDGSVKSQSYDGASIRITHQHTSAASGDTLQQFTYNYDDVGNMSERQDNLHQIAEQFSFDHLDRLTQAQVAGASPITFGFDKLGNMTEKSDLASAYQYTTAKLHAVTQLQNAGTTKSIQYDANGNLTGGDDMPSVTWTSYNKPSRIQKGKVMYNFYYGSDRKRYKKLRFKTATHYVGDSVEIIQTATPEIRYTLKANGVAFMVRRERGANVDHHYLHRDHLGSITAVTDEASGQIVERYSYDAWGKRRTATNWQAADVVTSLNYRGYTGHEHLDDVGIIHMNGRIYLPKLGKMMSPDPITQSPENGQNYSRYSYVFNNPLKFTDPSGYKSDIDSEHVKPVSAPAYEGPKTERERLPLEETFTYGRRSCSMSLECRRQRFRDFNNELGMRDWMSGRGGGSGGESGERKSTDPRNRQGDDSNSWRDASETDEFIRDKEDSLKIFEHFFKNLSEDLTLDDMTPDARKLATDMFRFALEENGDFEFLGNLAGKGGFGKPGALTILNRILKGEIRGVLDRTMTFEERLSSFNGVGGATNAATMLRFRREFDELFGG